jgi:eukaryotic-like serine/threonine-protein kinase
MLTLGVQSSRIWESALIGGTFDDYQIVSYIGRGGFALVFEAVELTTRRAVALKVLPPSDPEPSLEFQREGVLLSRLSGSSNVVTLHKTDRLSINITIAGGQQIPVQMPFHVLELAQGCLEELVLHRDKLEWVERLRLWRGVVLGVHQMHLREIVHRDLKSENCLLFVRPKNHTDCKVTDLGRSRHLPSPPLHNQQQYLTGLGDLRFAPPEFLAWQGDDSKKAHTCSDLYGLGSVLFELATGQGITVMSLGFGPEVVRANLSMLQRGQMIDLSGLRSEFESAFRMFESSVPAVIRPQTTALLRQLCDPEPVARLPKPNFSRKSFQPGLG